MKIPKNMKRRRCSCCKQLTREVFSINWNEVCRGCRDFLMEERARKNRSHTKG